MGKYFHLVATGLTLLLPNTVAGTIIRHTFVGEVHISNPGQGTRYSDWDISVVFLSRFRGGALNCGHSAASRAFAVQYSAPDYCTRIDVAQTARVQT